ncbi:uncharacterized protein LOC110048089 isoform X2 [Orbicella faveolata]|uniref:uncharacterized protein LOC110048089 isoform X2 n=1 Tax=Orbicella faveolata TaxID=48498 RepID=UPI0009E36DA1|nr:uncharacterized protein LOC110048089 isoform X2 [Orbicella faveolata]
MLPPQGLLVAILFFQFLRSGVSTTTLTAVTPSLSLSGASLQMNSSMPASNSGVITETPSAISTHNFSATSVAAPTTVANRGQGESSLLPTKSSASLVNQTASVSIAYIMWSSWREEKESDCQVKCCDTGGPVIRQIRNCTIRKARCEALNKCTDYGVTERDISCYTACECMHNAGTTEDVAVVFMIITNILALD